jgi:hypothetical protein
MLIDRVAERERERDSVRNFGGHVHRDRIGWIA